MKILVTGASGLVGKNLIRLALTQGHEVFALVRSPQKFLLLPPENIFLWKHDDEPPQAALENVDCIIHLAGENIADTRWSESRKKQLINSRIIGTQNLVKSLARLADPKRPQTLISASAIGYYGYQSAGQVTEEQHAGTDFLARLCLAWEEEALRASRFMRVVLARTGIVLSREGGALTKMPPIQIGNGQQWMSWIHIEDMCRLLLFCAENSKITGPVNMTSPHPIQNRILTQLLAAQLKIPVLLSTPKIFLKIALGELSQALLSSAQVHPQKAIDNGFQFLFPQIESALTSLLKEVRLFDQFAYYDQFVPFKPSEVFPYFSKAENLEHLTPPFLKFKIVSKSTPTVHKDTEIVYKLRVHGLPIKWKTHILEWRFNEAFVDNQVQGPYSRWHHTHLFEEVPGGTLLRDIVHYRIPGSLCGFLFFKKWVAGDIIKIFGYRQSKIAEFYSKGQT